MIARGCLRSRSLSAPNRWSAEQTLVTTKQDGKGWPTLVRDGENSDNSVLVGRVETTEMSSPVCGTANAVRSHLPIRKRRNLGRRSLNTKPLKAERSSFEGKEVDANRHSFSRNDGEIGDTSTGIEVDCSSLVRENVIVDHENTMNIPGENKTKCETPTTPLKQRHSVSPLQISRQRFKVCTTF